MVAQSQLADPPLADGVVQRAPAHLGAEGAGIVLLAHVKDDLLDVGLEAGIGDVLLPAQLRHRGKVHALKAQLDGDGLQLEGLGIEALQVL